MRTGIFGYKGHIHYQSAPCIDDWLSTLPPDLPKSEYFRMVANHIDQEIHLNYRLYPCNYIALDLLSGNDDQRNNYSNSDKQAFMDYLSGQLSKISIEHPDMSYLRECILTMYANPAINHLKAISKEAELI